VNRVILTIVYKLLSYFFTAGFIIRPADICKQYQQTEQMLKILAKTYMLKTFFFYVLFTAHFYVFNIFYFNNVVLFSKKLENSTHIVKQQTKITFSFVMQ